RRYAGAHFVGNREIKVALYVAVFDNHSRGKTAAVLAQFHDRIAHLCFFQNGGSSRILSGGSTMSLTYCACLQRVLYVALIAAIACCNSISSVANSLGVGHVPALGASRKASLAARCFLS